MTTVQIYWDDYFHGANGFGSYRRKDTGSLGLGAGWILGLMFFSVGRAAARHAPAVGCASLSSEICGNARDSMSAQEPSRASGGLCLSAIPCDSFEELRLFVFFFPLKRRAMRNSPSGARRLGWKESGLKSTRRVPWWPGGREGGAVTKALG